MIRSRSASLRLLHAAISFRVRPQPTHRPVRPSTAQVLTHGEETVGMLTL